MKDRQFRIRITFNAPAILTFALACVAVQGVNVLTQGASNRLLFSTYRASLLNPLTWLRCVTHVLGHADWGHLLNNMMLLLVVGRPRRRSTAPRTSSSSCWPRPSPRRW